jgi:hypothetical protein
MIDRDVDVPVKRHAQLFGLGLLSVLYTLRSLRVQALL